MSYQFPTDPDFRRRAARLADYVQVAIWRGLKVRPMNTRDGDCCPLGAHLWMDPLVIEGYPADTGEACVPLTLEELGGFLRGFDSDSCYLWWQSRPWFELGRAYRERFK